MNGRGNIPGALVLAAVAFCFFEFVMHRQSDIFREYAAALLSLQWMLLACLVVWGGTFLLLAFNWQDLPLIGLLLIAIAAYFLGTAGRAALDALTLLGCVTLGKRGESFLRSLAVEKYDWQKTDLGEIRSRLFRNLVFVNSMSVIRT